MSKKLLLAEALEFVTKGSEINIVNPQSSAEGEFGGKFLIIDGRRKLDLTRLDYLSLGSSPTVKAIMHECIDECDLSCPASQLVTKTGPNIMLEQALAGMHGMKESIVFTSGYSVNENLMQAIGLRMNTSYLAHYCRQAGMGTVSKKIPTIFFVDSESHFSLQHGIRLAKAQIGNDKCIAVSFPSGDYEQLIRKLIASRKNHGENAIRVIISDTLSSASGKIFDVETLCKIAENYDCMLYLDEAHAIGAIGPEGRGVVAGVKNVEQYLDRILLMGTLTKTFSLLGGYIAMADTSLSWFLRFCSPQYIFSAPVPPWMASALSKIITLLRGEFGELERNKLNVVSQYMRNRLVAEGFNILGSTSHIIPINIGNDVKSDLTKAYLEGCGYITSLFKYPAVPKGEALVRFSLCSDVTIEEIDGFIKHLAVARKKFDF